MILDSNIVIYSIGPDAELLRPYISHPAAGVAAVTFVEVLGYHKLSPDAKARFEVIFANVMLFSLSAPVLDRAVSFRQHRRMGLSDSIIAATARVHDLELVTRNTADFAWIPGLKLINPFAPPGS